MENSIKKIVFFKFCNFNSGQYSIHHIEHLNNAKYRFNKVFKTKLLKIEN